MTEHRAVTLDVPGVPDEATPAHGFPTVPYVERKVAEARHQTVVDATAAAKQETFAALLKTRLVVLFITGGGLGITLGGVAAFAFELETRAADAGAKSAQAEMSKVSGGLATVDAGLKGIEARTTVLEQQRTADRSEFNARFERLETQGNRAERKLDALLDKEGVPNPAPAPKDGGHP